MELHKSARSQGPDFANCDISRTVVLYASTDGHQMRLPGSTQWYIQHAYAARSQIKIIGQIFNLVGLIVNKGTLDESRRVDSSP